MNDDLQFEIDGLELTLLILEQEFADMEADAIHAEEMASRMK